MYQELPDFLKENKYSDITDNCNTVFQVAHETKLPTFLWFDAHPRAANPFNKYMRYYRKKQAICWDVYPVEQETQEWDSNATVLVDVGSNFGQMSALFKRKFPEVPGQVVLQDAPEMIDRVYPIEGVKTMVHDIFGLQPIKGMSRSSFTQPPSPDSLPPFLFSHPHYPYSIPFNDPTGAKYYLLPFILQNWPDKQCRLILINIINAMSPASRILIDEMVLPDARVHWHSTSRDLTVMAAMGARERTRTQWAELLDSVGLVIEAVRTYLPVSEQSVMTVGRKQ